MKHEFGMKRPECLIEDWPGKYKVFSWLEYVVTVPNPIFLITTRKSSGLSNANLHSWGLLLGEGDHFMSLIAVLKHQHNYQNIRREKEWCLNFPSFNQHPASFETIYNNEADADEIEAAGFTIEHCQEIEANRIHECLVNIECRLAWQRELYFGSSWDLFAGDVVHVTMDEEAMDCTPEERMKKMRLMYNIRSTVNPLTGDQYGPNTVGLLNEVVKITSDDGTTKLWRK